MAEVREAADFCRYYAQQARQRLVREELRGPTGERNMLRMDGRGDTRDQRGGRRGQKGDGNPRATVVRIVQRAYKQLVGTLEFHHGHPILKPDDHRARHRILLLPDGLPVARIEARPGPRMTAQIAASGVIAMVIGMTLLLFALQGGKVGIVSTLSALSPVLILPVLWVVTGERPPAASWAGALIAVTGMALIFLR